jgi:hypothetical protein
MKYVVFLSPSLISLSLDLCLALISFIFQSLSNFRHKDFLLSLSCEFRYCYSTKNSNPSTSDIMLAFLFLSSPPIFLLHPLILFLSSLIFVFNISMGSEELISMSKVLLTTSTKPSTSDHHFSNLKRGSFTFPCSPALIRNGLWSLTPFVGVFCTGKIQGGQDRAFQFRGALANYKARGDLSWFSPLFRGNSPTSRGLI